VRSHHFAGGRTSQVGVKWFDSAFRRIAIGSVIALVLGVLALPMAAIAVPALDSVASANGVPLQAGDVLASVGNGLVDNYSPTGTLNDTLDTSTDATYTTGGCFDSSGNFYVTDFDSDEISEFQLFRQPGER